MIIPANFVAGALVGAVSTYVVKDDTAKTWLKNTGNKLKKGGSSVISPFKKKKADDDNEAAKKGEVIDGVAEEVAAKEADKATATDTSTESVKEDKKKSA